MHPDPTIPTSFSVHVAPRAEGGTQVTIFGELDGVTAPQAQEALERAVNEPGKVVIDLRACGFIDSMGIAVIAGAASRLKDDGRHLVIIGAGTRMLRTFEIAGLTDGPLITIEGEQPGT
jgi:anti-anti-sigma factor